MRPRSANPSRDRGAGPLEAPRRPPAAQPAHEDPQVVACRRHQVALGDCDQAAQPTPARAAALADMGEGALRVLAPLLLQALAAGTPHAPPVGAVGPLPVRGLVGPDPPLGALLL